MALRTTTAIVVASVAITLAVIQSDGLRLSVMDADGSNQVNLTNNPATDSIPSWSPDGSKIDSLE